MIDPSRCQAAVEKTPQGHTLVLRLPLDRDNLPGEADYRKQHLTPADVRGRIVGSFGQLAQAGHGPLHDLAVSALALQPAKAAEPAKPLPGKATAGAK